MSKKKQIRELQEVVEALELALRETNKTVNQMGADLHRMFDLQINGFSSDPGKRITDLQRILLLMPGFKEAVEAYGQRPPVTPSAAWVRSATEVQAIREEAAKAHQDGNKPFDGIRGSGQ